MIVDQSVNGTNLASDGRTNSARPVAYFSMEIAVDPAVPTYSGGLGVLAGDTLHSAADIGFPMVGVTLLYRQGYFRQHLDELGRQTEQPAVWTPEAFLQPIDAMCTVEIEGRTVHIRGWRYRFQGVTGSDVPVYFLDTDLPDNDPRDRALTGVLYGGDARYRVCQEVVLGLGGLAMLRALGYSDLRVYHMNEGHAAFLALALLDEATGEEDPRAATPAQLESVRARCVFTTHTPVEPGQDRFPLDLIRSVLGEHHPVALGAEMHLHNGIVNMAYLALDLARYTNAVSRRHREISTRLFPGYDIHAVTNGVHAGLWTSPAFAALYDRHLPQWRQDNFYLRDATSLPADEVWETHLEAKRGLLAQVERRTRVRLDPTVMTIGFARRAATYKRADLLFTHPERLVRIVDRVGPLQIIFGGKAHPHDEAGKEMIQRLFQASHRLEKELRIIYLEEYDMALGQLLCAGVDLWLNNPQKPLEASGTSGMKAALNGVPSLSVLDGWWTEGHHEGLTGWSIGNSQDPEEQELELDTLYDKLEYVIVPLFYRQPLGYAAVMRSAIALNGSFFNTQRMLLQYIRNAYASALQVPLPSGRG